MYHHINTISEAVPPKKNNGPPGVVALSSPAIVAVCLPEMDGCEICGPIGFLGVLELVNHRKTIEKT